MEKGFIYLIIIELIVLAIIVGTRLLFNYLEARKIKRILNYIDKRAHNDKDVSNRIQECINAIKQSTVNN